MKGINHLVLAGHDLDAMRATYAELGFTITPRGQHPFGTGNSLVQLQGSYLELLSVTVPQDVPEHRGRNFSFAAFNRDYLARHEGFSMLVLDTTDAAADRAAWRSAGLQTYEPFDFARAAQLPDGETIKVGFSLAFVTHRAAPWLGLFACQHYRPDYFAQARYMTHANGATRIEDVWIVSETAPDLAGYLATVTGVVGENDGAGRTEFRTRVGTIVLAQPDWFQEAFGVAPPHPEDGPRLAGYTIVCEAPERLPGLRKVGARHILPPERGFGTAVGFTRAER